MANEYQNGLFGCFSDFRLSCLTFVAPCYTQGKNAEHFGEDCLVHGLVGMVGVGFGSVTRWRLREQRGIAGSMLKDALVYTFCGCCAAVQDAREIGWSLPKEVANAGKGMVKGREDPDNNQTEPDQSKEMTRE